MIGWIVLAVMVGAIIGWIFCSLCTMSKMADYEDKIMRLKGKVKVLSLTDAEIGEMMLDEVKGEE